MEEHCEQDNGVKIVDNNKKIIESVNKRELTPKELESILRAHDTRTSVPKTKGFKDLLGDHAKIGIISDTHIGHKEFDEELFAYAGETFRKYKVDRVYHCGDILEGMSGREGHVYELAQIGFSSQMKYAEQLFKKHFKGLQICGINGNHDLWYSKKNNGGVNVSAELENRLDNYKHLGDEEADIEIGKGIWLKLFHPNDGSAYAWSYKLQKLVESFQGGRKPNIVVEGHYHKSLYMFLRNVHALEAGTICSQTPWMRGKKISANKGFWILDLEFNKAGIGKFQPTFYPGYK